MSNPIENTMIKALDAYVGAFLKADEKFNIVDKMERMEQKNIEFQEEHPILNVGLQLTKGTVKGILGSYLHK